MSIWTSSKVVVGFVLGLSLAACDTSGEGFNLLEQLTPEQSETETRPNVALASAEMMRGRMTLSPPAGYCIDKRSLKQNFAVLARCDSLGAPGGVSDVPLGMIIVAVTEVEGVADIGAIERKLINPDADILRRSDTDEMSLVQLRGPTPVGTSALHWRGFAQIGTNVVSLRAYAPEDGAMAEAAGGAVLQALVRNSAKNTAVKTVADQPARGNSQPRRGLGGLISGLFD